MSRKILAIYGIGVLSHVAVWGLYMHQMGYYTPNILHSFETQKRLAQKEALVLIWSGLAWPIFTPALLFFEAFPRAVLSGAKLMSSRGGGGKCPAL